MCSPVVFVAVELMIGRDVWIESGSVEEVACDFRLQCQVVPKLEWEVDVSGAQATDEVIFESLDGSFSGVDSVVVGLDKLNGTVTRSDKLFDGRCCLIVGDVEGGGKSL